MQLTQQRSPVKITGDNVKTQQFRIQFNAKMAKILSDGLYSDKILAIIRELSTNAYDAHVAAGKQNVPFNVTLPSSFSPQFIIEDFGVGLTPDQVNDIYTVYGASDKENTNTAIGCLGLGSKTPFAYNTRTCTIESRVDGTAYIYSALIGEDGLPTLAKLSENPTNKPNGVKITIPVNRNDIHNFQNKAKEVYEWFNPRPNITNATITFSKPTIVAQGKDWELRNDGACSAIMGIVRYPIQFSDSALKAEEVKMMGHPFYIKFDIGDLDIEVSREGLSYDLKTRSAITAKFKQIRNEIADIINKDIDSQPSLWDARLKAVETSNILYQYVDRAKLTWQKKILFPQNQNWNTQWFELELDKANKIGKYNSYSSLSKFKPDDTLVIKINRNIHFIINDVDKGIHSRVFHWKNTNNISGTIYFIDPTQRKMVEDLLGLPANSSLFILGSSLPKPAPKPRTNTGTGIKRGNTEPIMELKDGGRTLSSYYTNVQKDIDEGGKYFEFNTFKCVYNGTELEPKKIIDVKAALEFCGVKQKEPIYAIKTAQIKRLAKAKKPWVEYVDYALKELDKVYSSLSYNNLEQIDSLYNWFGNWDYSCFGGQTVRILSMEDFEEINKHVTKKDFNQLVTDIGNLAKIKEQSSLKKTVENLYNTLGRQLPKLNSSSVKDAKTLCDKVKKDCVSIMRKYPLLIVYDRYNKMPDEIAVYINAK